MKSEFMIREVRALRLIIISITLFIFCTGYNLASEPAELSDGEEHPQSHNEINENHHKKFDPGTFIFDHIADSYDWPIIDIGKLSINIPLPVILYSKEKGIVLFMSSKFHHGHAVYKGFHIGQEGEKIEKMNSKGEIEKIEVKGKIVETHSNGIEVLPFDISITKNVAALFFSIFLILFIFINIGNAYKRNPLSPPKGLQSLLEPVILFVRDDIAKSSIGEKKYERFMPYLLTIFFFIWINNMLGLIPIFPGGANVTGNIAVTMVLALFTFIITAINGNKIYWKHIFNTPGVPVWLKIPPLPIMPIIEMIGIFTKPFVLMIRLFANISAGHIITFGFLSLIFLFGEMNQYLGLGVSVVSVLFIMFMTLLELLVAFIQAYIFTFLSALYFGMAVEEHH